MTGAFTVLEPPTFPLHGSCGTLVVSRTSEEEKHDETTLARNLLSLSGRV
jgi:hypothetical protein